MMLIFMSPVHQPPSLDWQLALAVVTGPKRPDAADRGLGSTISPGSRVFEAAGRPDMMAASA